MTVRAHFFCSTPQPRDIRLKGFEAASRLVFGLAFVASLSYSPSSHSQVLQVTPPVRPAGLPAKPPVSRPSWAELTPSQQQALAPLASSWNMGMREAQKRKWLEISKNYGTLSPEGQATLNSRMNEWVALSPQQRAQARLNFGRTRELARQLTPEEKKARWEAYQALSPEEKQNLAAKASPNPTGAATAVKPVSPQKLAVVPLHPAKPGVKPEPKTTALPTPAAQTAPAAPVATPSPPATPPAPTSPAVSEAPN